MGRRRLWGMLILFGLLSSGCAIQSMPLSLMAPPKMNYSQEDVKKAIQSYLPKDSQLIIPKEQEELSAINYVDLDGDGKEEIVVFYSLPKDLSTLGILILKSQDGTNGVKSWNIEDNFTELGKDIVYANFADFTGDGHSDIIIGLSGGEKLNNELTLYTYQFGRGEVIESIPYQDMAVGDVNGDGQVEVAILNQEEKDYPEVKLTLYHYAAQQMQKIDEKKLDGYASEVKIARAASEKVGIFVDMQIGAHSAYTELYFLQGSKLMSPFKDKPAIDQTFKAYPLNCMDINNDGIMEIGIQKEPFGSENLPMVATPWFNAWYQWNGQGGLAWQMESYGDYSEGYEFIIPKSWQDRFTIKRITEGDEISAVEFYYTGKDRSQWAKLLTIQYCDKQTWSAKEEQLQVKNRPYTVVGENLQKLFVAVPEDEQENLPEPYLKEYKQINLQKEELKSCFRFQ